MIDKRREKASRARIFAAIREAAPTAEADVATIEAEALAILDESVCARPDLTVEDVADAMVQRIDQGRVVGTSCERIESLAELPATVEKFLADHELERELRVQKTAALLALDWQSFCTEVDITRDNTVGLCWAEYGIAETGSFVVHSGAEMPVLLNFLPLYLIAVVPRSRILPYMDDYALIANEIARQGATPRNMCIVSGASGTTDIEGVLVQGAHGPEVLRIVVVESL